MPPPAGRRGEASGAFRTTLPTYRDLVREWVRSGNFASFAFSLGTATTVSPLSVPPCIALNFHLWDLPAPVADDFAVAHVAP